MNASPALTMIGSASSTQPPSPTVAVASRPKPLAGAGVDPEDRHPPPGLDALQVEPGDEPVVRKAEGEPGVLI